MPAKQHHWVIVFKTLGGFDNVSYKWYGTAVAAMVRGKDWAADLERQGIEIVCVEIRQD